jgi:hypothetical protein
MTRNCSSQTDEVLLGDLDQLEEFPSKTFPQSSFKIIGKWLLPNMAQVKNKNITSAVSLKKAPVTMSRIHCAIKYLPFQRLCFVLSKSKLMVFRCLFQLQH